jgi:N-acetylmuramoyl-L-alanine amidase
LIDYMKKRKLRKEVYYVLLSIVLIIITIFVSVSANSGGRYNADGQKGNAASAVNKIIRASSQKDNSQTGSVSSSISETSLEKTVIIDPGHGGSDPGATGVGGVVEKDLNLIIAKKLQSTLDQAGFAIIMTREDDRSIYDAGSISLAEMKDSDLNNRIMIIKEHPHAIFISIHQNSDTNATYFGTQVYYSANNPNSKILAKMIQAEVKKELEPNNTRNVHPPGILRVLLKAPTPAVLIECGFISNQDDARNLQNGDYQDELVSKITKATSDFYNQNSHS